MDYKTLQQFTPDKFLNPDNFITPFDSLPEKKIYADKQYHIGRDYGFKSKAITISYRGVWGAVMNDGSITTSYEGIGYHRCTADLLRGFLDSHCDIYLTRLEKNGQGESEWNSYLIQWDDKIEKHEIVTCITPQYLG